MKNKLKKWIYAFSALLLIIAILAVLYVSFGLLSERKTAANFASRYVSSRYYTECDITKVKYNYKNNSYTVYVAPKRSIWCFEKEATIDYEGTMITIILDLDKTRSKYIG